MQTCPDAMFASSCCQLLNWLQSHPIISPIIGKLGDYEGENLSQISKIVDEVYQGHRTYNPGSYDVTEISEHAPICLRILQGIASYKSNHPQNIDFLIRCFGEFFTGKNHIQIDEATQTVRDVAIDGLFEYLDEQLDTRNVIYGVLLKYKQRAEWFRKTRLREIADTGQEGRNGERSLAIHLQEYVFDQGVEFFIEPSSVSGEADLILKSSEDRYIVLDAKYIKDGSSPSDIRRKLSSGFHQVYRYCSDYNEPEGFLAVYVQSPITINLELEYQDGIPYIQLGGKTIYYLEVNIANLPSASRAGKPQEVFVSVNELVESLENTIAD